MIGKRIYRAFILLFLFSSVVSIGQTRKEKKADRNFDAYAYVDAIRMYESMAEQGYMNTSILSKLGDSYYFNGKFPEAYKWYEQLFDGTYEDKNLATLDPEYYYRYAQTLKTVNQVAKSDEILQEFATLRATDSRAQLWISNDELVEQTLPASRFTLFNLSTNSAYSDYGATLLENQLIFTSARVNEEMRNKVHNWTNQEYTKLYATTIDGDGNFETPVLFAKEIASKDLNMGTAVFTKDGKTMYFTSNSSSTRGSKKGQYNAEDTALLKIYKAEKQANGRWGKVVELPFNVEGYNTAHPALTPDEKWMYFVSDRQGSLGQSDLFRVGIYNSDIFGQVENLGTDINTAGRETFPFISSDYFLYFSSDGHTGFGGLDLYKAKISTEGILGVPVNLGPDINSAFDDFGFYFDNQTKKGFMTSNRDGGYGGDDIYLFVEKPCIQLIDGLVHNQENEEGIAKVEVLVFDKMHKQVGRVQSDELGYYRLDNLKCGEEYRVRVLKEGFFTKEVAVKTDRKIQSRLNIALESDGVKITAGDDLFNKLRLSPIYFNFDQATIRPDAQIELMKIVEVMRQHPSLVIDVRSHTDSRGNDAYNMKLSERRAQATIKWMIGKGIEASRLTGKGYGESQLVNACSNGVKCSEEQHQENRRSEFIIMDM